MSILLLDNYDSFTFNLQHLIEKISDEDVTVVRNDKIKLDEINDFDSIILSPGPGLPSEAGIMKELINHYFDKKKILGVCLGMQAIGENFGAKLKNLNEVVHGEERMLNVVEKDELFKGCPSYFYVGRYHSWVIDSATIPTDLVVLAEDGQQEIMAIKHVSLPIYGLQFHPESILSQYSEILIKNWLSL